MSPIHPCPDGDCGLDSDLVIVGSWLASLNQQLGGGPSKTGGHRFRFSDRGRRGSTGRPSQFRSGPSRISRGAASPEGNRMQVMSYRTAGGIRIQREISDQPYRSADNALAGALDTRRGVLFSSSFEFPGRYTRWDMGFVDPPLVFTARGRRFTIDALNPRGHILLAPIAEVVGALAATTSERTSADRISGAIGETTERFAEERRSRQPSVFSVLRALGHLFASSEDQHLGL